MNADEVDWIEAAGNYVKLHAGYESYLIRETISGLESRFDPIKVLRIRRTVIVNIGLVNSQMPATTSPFESTSR